MAAELQGAVHACGWSRNPPTDPQTFEHYLGLLTHLYEIGRRDLPLGRLIEGHVDAVQIVQRYGAAAQIERLGDALAKGATLGVWNASLPEAPLRLNRDRLHGGKSYASGAGVLSHACVTAQCDRGTQLLLIDLADVPPDIDRDWWQVTGMQRSETHQVRWQGAGIDDDARIGEPDLYAREPYFSGGALRFVAVHAGGIAGICDLTRDHLVATDRAGDPFQNARLAELYQLADLAAAVVRRTAAAWFETDDEVRLARVASARLTVTNAAERSIILAREAVGLPSQFRAHPLSAMLTDLAVYLRQPAFDAQRLRVGRAVQQGVLAASL